MKLKRFNLLLGFSVTAICQGLEPAMALGIHKNLSVMEEIAGKYQTPYLSPADFHPLDDWFVDGFHLNEDGEHAKAEWILGGVLRVLDTP